MTACGHVYHAACCQQSELATLQASGAWHCPCCRELVTTMECSYKNIILDKSPVPTTTGDDLGAWLDVLSHPVLTARTILCTRALFSLQ